MPLRSDCSVTVEPLKVIFEETTFFKILDFFLSKGNDSYYGAPLIARAIGLTPEPVRRCLNAMQDERGIVKSIEDNGKKYKLTDEHYKFLTDFQTWYLKWKKDLLKDNP